MKYNFLEWWLSTKIKPLPYRIWRYIAFFVVFIVWVSAIAIFRQYYWKISLCVILPAIVIDLILNGIIYYFYNKKLKIEKDNL